MKTALLVIAVIALSVACGGGAKSQPQPTTTRTCEAGPNHPLCDADHVVESFVRIIRGPEEQGSADMATARARLTTLEDAREEIESSGAEKISGAQMIPTPNQVWLIQVRGEFVLHQLAGVGILPSPTPRRGTLYGVLALNTGSVVLLAFLPE